jgi:hypothetical protein
MGVVGTGAVGASDWLAGAVVELFGDVCHAPAIGLSGKLSAPSVGSALAPGSAKSTTNAMHAAANHRVRANRLTSILLREPIAQTGRRGLSLLREMQFPAARVE